MIGFWMMGIVSVIGIGSTIALITTWIGGKRISCGSGIVLVAVLCLSYHALASTLHFLTFTIIVPFGFGFGSGNVAFALALLTQSILAAIIGMWVYWAINKKRLRNNTPYSEPDARSPQG